MADIGNYFGCSIDASLYLATPVSAGGNGYGASCRWGQMHIDGGIFPSVNIDGQYARFNNRLFPSGVFSKQNTSVYAESLTAYLGLTSLDRASKTNADYRVTHTIDNESKTSVGVGQVTVGPDNKFNIVTIQKVTGAGYGIQTSSTTQARVKFGISKESILNYNNESTAAAQSIPKNSRNISLWIGVELAHFNPAATFQTLNRHIGSFLAVFEYVYSDSMRSASAVIDYLSLNRDAAIVTEKTNDILGKSNTGPTHIDALSGVRTIEGGVALVSGIGRGTQLDHFTQMNETAQKWLFTYHIGHSVILAYIAANSMRPDALAPAVASSAHQAIDLIPIMLHGSRQQILASRLGSSVAMMLIGALLAGGKYDKYSKAFSQAGIEGAVASASRPNPLASVLTPSEDDRNWLAETTHEYFPWNSYHRSQSSGDLSDSRSSYHHRINFKTEEAHHPYIAYSLHTPPANASDTAAIIETELPGSSGTLQKPLHAAHLPTSVKVSLGYEISSGNDNSTFRLHGSVGGGVEAEYSQNGLTSGLMGEAGIRASVHTTLLDVPISFGPTARCSATKFMDGYSTDCSAGISLSIE